MAADRHDFVHGLYLPQTTLPPRRVLRGEIGAARPIQPVGGCALAGTGPKWSC